MRMEESALIVRMQFTTKPGEQWVIRREAYRNVRDALAAEGIHFAHREVRVRVPELEQLEENSLPGSEHGPAAQAEGTTSGESPSKEQIRESIGKAAAAAATGVIAAEASRQGKLDGDDMDDEM